MHSLVGVREIPLLRTKLYIPPGRPEMVPRPRLAVSMQRREDVTGFIRSFTGSHHFVLDYLLEEVLEQQPDRVY